MRPRRRVAKVQIGYLVRFTLHQRLYLALLGEGHGLAAEAVHGQVQLAFDPEEKRVEVRGVLARAIEALAQLAEQVGAKSC